MAGYLRPSSIKEAVEALDYEKCFIVAGGTDFMVKNKSLAEKFNKPVLFLSGIKEMREIKKEDGFIVIGACCTCSDIEKSTIIPDFFKECIRQMASPAIRNAATIGGNICNASPAGDTLPYLYAYSAKLVLQSIMGKREVEIDKFIKGPGKKDLNYDEILTYIKIPDEDFNIKFYKKAGTRKSTALSKLSFTGLARKEENILKDIRIAFGAVGPAVIRSRDFELEIIQMAERGINIPKVLNMYRNIIVPIDDQRSTALYRKEVSLRLLEEFLKSLQAVKE